MRRQQKEQAERERLRQESERRKEREDEDALDKAIKTVNEHQHVSQGLATIARTEDVKSLDSDSNSPSQSSCPDKSAAERERQRQREQDRRRREAVSYNKNKQKIVNRLSYTSIVFSFCSTIVQDVIFLLWMCGIGEKTISLAISC